MCIQPQVASRRIDLTAAPGLASRARAWLALQLFCVICCAGTPASALTVMGISANANCDAVTGLTLSGASGATIVRDGAGILIAWVGSSGPFISFESPTNNAQWTATDGNGPVTFAPSNLAPQCAPASLAVTPAGDFSATIVRGGLGSPPTGIFAVSNAGGSVIYLPATAYFPGGVAFFSLSSIPSIGPQGSANLAVSFNAAAFNLAPGRYSASIDFSNAGNPSLVTTRQIHLTVVVGFSHDFNGDGFSDIAWRNTNGDTAIWLMNVNGSNGAQILSTADYGIILGSWSIVGQRDFNGDGKADLLWSNTNGDTSIWLMNGTQVASTKDFGIVGNGWSIVGTGDFNGDGFGDILWRNTNGDTSIWLMTGTPTTVSVLSTTDLGFVPTSWSVAQTGDFNGDGKADILWRNTNGDTSVWLMTASGTQMQVLSATDLGFVPTSWKIAGTGDFNGDSKSDILWHNTNGDTSIWLMTSNGTQVQVLSTTDLGFVPMSWDVALTGDFNGNGKSDILWRNTNGDISIWFGDYQVTLRDVHRRGRTASRFREQFALVFALPHEVPITSELLSVAHPKMGRHDLLVTQILDGAGGTALEICFS
jgi:FG-GAP-like repeat